MADPSPRRLSVQIVTMEANQPPRVVWEGTMSPDNLRKLTTTASGMWVDALAESARRFEQDVKGILAELKEVAQDHALGAAKGLAKITLKQVAKLRESVLDQSTRSKHR